MQLYIGTWIRGNRVTSRRPKPPSAIKTFHAGRVYSGKHKATVWCPSVSLSRFFYSVNAVMTLLA